MCSMLFHPTKVLLMGSVISFKIHSAYCNSIPGPRYYLDILAIDVFGKFVPTRNFKKRTVTRNTRVSY